MKLKDCIISLSLCASFGLTVVNAAPFDQIGPSIKLFGIKDINPQSEGKSAAYSPWVMHLPPWGSYLMYHCLANDQYQGKSWQDQVWRTESWTGGDGNFVNHHPSIIGGEGSNQEEACSPGVAIAPNNWWHMYYVASPKEGSMQNLGIFHAIAPNPGLVWNDANQFHPIALPYPQGTYYETPSPVFVGDTLFMSLVVGEPGGTTMAQSIRILQAVNSNSFTEISKPVINRNGQNDNSNVSHGRVTYSGGVLYLVYSKARHNPTFPDTIALATSQDAVTWTYQKDLISISNRDSWDSRYVWSPQIIENNNQLWLYYVGNDYRWKDDTSFFGYGGSIGLRKFSKQ